MARELEFDGYWEGAACYTCDCHDCKKAIRIRFDSEEEAKNYKTQNDFLRANGWMHTKVNDSWRDFCSEPCRNRFIRQNTI